VRPRRAASLVVVAAAALAAGCGTRKQQAVDFSETPREYVATDYERVYENWTRHEQVLQEADVALEVWATFKSWEFREAYVERYANVYALSDADRKTLRDAQQEGYRTAYEFHVVAQSTQFKWNDLEKESSAWRTRLIDALGHELTPEYIRVQKLPDAYERTFFPRKTPFSKTYAIRFVAPAESNFAGVKAGSLVLRFTSPIGRAELEWRAKI
jgi:hypothetical protein